jgi:hypothetical protein
MAQVATLGHQLTESKDELIITPFCLIDDLLKAVHHHVGTPAGVSEPVSEGADAAESCVVGVHGFRSGF